MKKLICLAILCGCANGCGNSPSYNLHIDNHFSAEEKQEILAAYSDWETKTGLVHMDNVYSFDGVVIADPVRIMGNIYIVKQGNLPDSHSGYTNGSKTGAVIYLDPSLDQKFFGGAITHEFGHAFGLGHYFGNEPSIMTPVLDDASPKEVQPVDVEEFDKVWK